MLNRIYQLTTRLAFYHTILYRVDLTTDGSSLFQPEYRMFCNTASGFALLDFLIIGINK